jgi:hypothetical protein
MPSARPSLTSARLLEFGCQVSHIAETGQRLIACCAARGSATEQAFIQQEPGSDWP